MGRAPQRIPYATYVVPPAPKPLDPAALPHYWHPDRDGVEPCPRAFAEQLARISKDLAICRPPAGAPLTPRSWAVWYRRDRVKHHLCPGWLLLFIWQERGEIAGKLAARPLPLDERLFANLYRCSARAFGGSVKYWEHVVATIKAEYEARDKADKVLRDDKKHDYWNYTKIKNIGSGSRFARHHDGSVVPSRGEANWVAERGFRDLPADVERDQRERPRLSKRQLTKGKR